MFIASFLMVTFATTAMHNSQLQLQNPTQQNEIPTLDNYSLMISARYPIIYASQSIHADIFNESNLQSTIKDPVISVNIMHNATPKKINTLTLPLKQFINCDTKSMVQLYSADFIKGKPIIINALCKANPKLYKKENEEITNNTFARQLNTYENEFYKNSMVFIADGDDEQAFESANILTTTTIYIPLSTDNFSFFEEKTILSHNPENGCPDRKALIKQITDEEIPHHQNWVTYLTNREYGNKLGKQQ